MMKTWQNFVKRKHPKEKKQSARDHSSSKQKSLKDASHTKEMKAKDLQRGGPHGGKGTIKYQNFH